MPAPPSDRGTAPLATLSALSSEVEAIAFEISLAQSKLAEALRHHRAAVSSLATLSARLVEIERTRANRLDAITNKQNPQNFS